MWKRQSPKSLFWFRLRIKLENSCIAALSGKETCTKSGVVSRNYLGRCLESGFILYMAMSIKYKMISVWTSFMIAQIIGFCWGLDVKAIVTVHVSIKQRVIWAPHSDSWIIFLYVCSMYKWWHLLVQVQAFMMMHVCIKNFPPGNGQVAQELDKLAFSAK